MLKLKLFFAILLFAVLLNAQVIDRFNKFVLIEDIENAFQTQSRLTLQKKQQYIFDRLIYNITTGDNNLYTYDLANQSMGITKKLTKEQIINDARIIGHPIPTLGRQFESLLIKDTLVLDTICIKLLLSLIVAKVKYPPVHAITAPMYIITAMRISLSVNNCDNSEISPLHILIQI